MVPTGVFPRGAPRPTRSHAEKTLHRALVTDLPKGWTAWHSLRARADKTWEGEGDFVIAVPDRGAIVLEVKGGAIDVKDGKWFQNGRLLEMPPRDQAHRFARLLRTKLEERGCTAPYIAIATAFPETAFAREPTHGDMEGAILGRHDLAHLGTALERIADATFPREGPRARRPRDAKWIEVLHAIWGETWKPKLALGKRARMREAELVALERRAARHPRAHRSQRAIPRDRRTGHRQDAARARGV